MKKTREVVFVLGLCLLFLLSACSKVSKDSVINTGSKVYITEENKQLSGSFLLQDKDSREKINHRQEEVNHTVVSCPNGVCEISDIQNEKECLNNAGRWDDRQEKCINQTKQELVKEKTILEKQCNKKKGTYVISENGIGECIVIESDEGKECVGPNNCISNLCEVENDNDIIGKCSAEIYFSGCKKFLSSKRKAVTICK